MRPGPIVAALAVTVWLAACSDDDRPTEADWALEWEAERALLPNASTLLDAGRPLCDELVGEYREVMTRLTPTPTDALDDAVEAWVDGAESLVFECPDDPEEVERRLDALAILAAEIDAGVDTNI